MALPTSKSTKSSVREPTKKEEKILELLAQGLRPADVAKRLAKGDKAKAKRLRARIWRLVRSDAQFQRRMLERAQSEVMLGAIPAGKGLAKRASRKTDAAKLTFEMTGLHNTKVKHEHSGDIKISLDVPRPRFVDAEAQDDEQIEGS